VCADATCATVVTTATFVVDAVVATVDADFFVVFVGDFVSAAADDDVDAPSNIVCGCVRMRAEVPCNQLISKARQV
jgi:hypothetical protein